MILLKLIGLTFILVMGLKIAMSDKMILEKLGKYFEKKIDEGHKVYNLFYCQWCMSTPVSLVAYGFAFGLEILPLEFNWKLVIMWPLVVMGSSFVCGNAWNIYETINKIRDKNEAEAAYYTALFESHDQSSEN